MLVGSHQHVFQLSQNGVNPKIALMSIFALKIADASRIYELLWIYTGPSIETNEMPTRGHIELVNVALLSTLSSN